jgi:hypothetical protein
MVNSGTAGFVMEVAASTLTFTVLMHVNVLTITVIRNTLNIFNTSPPQMCTDTATVTLSMLSLANNYADKAKKD